MFHAASDWCMLCDVHMCMILISISVFQLDLSSEVNIEELENREVPRGSSRRGEGTRQKDTKLSLDAEARPKAGRSKAAMARKRAKRRELYLKALQALGKYDPTRPVKPDPER